LTKPLSRDSAIPKNTKTPKSVSQKDELPANTAITGKSKNTNLRSKKEVLPDKLPANTTITGKSKNTNLRSENEGLPAGTATAAGTKKQKPHPNKSGSSAASAAAKMKGVKIQIKSGLKEAIEE
jgi:hypothetical protein